MQTYRIYIVPSNCCAEVTFFAVIKTVRKILNNTHSLRKTCWRFLRVRPPGRATNTTITAISRIYCLLTSILSHRLPISSLQFTLIHSRNLSLMRLSPSDFLTILQVTLIPSRNLSLLCLSPSDFLTILQFTLIPSRNPLSYVLRLFLCVESESCKFENR
jgi:hypothetical protein